MPPGLTENSDWRLPVSLLSFLPIPTNGAPYYFDMLFSEIN